MSPTTLRKLSLLTLAASGLAFGLAGCKKSGPALVAAPPATLAAGWTLASDAESGLSMGMPPGWHVGMPKGQVSGMATGSEYSATPDAMDAMGGGAAGAAGGAAGGVAGGAADGGDPSGVGGMMGSSAEDAKAEKAALAKLHEQGIVLQCVDDGKGTIGESPTRFYLQVYKGCGGIEGAKDMVKDEMVNEGEGKAVSTPVGEAWLYQNKGQNRIGDTERHVTYVFGDGSDAYVLRFTSTNSPTVFDVFHADVAKSLRKSGAAKS